MEYKIEKIKNHTAKLTIDNSLFDIDAIYKSGQCFTIKKENNKYIITSSDKLCVIIKEEKISYIYFLALEENYWISYFNLNTPFNEYLKTMKTCDNEFIKKCANYSTGLIILKQDLWETIVSFIISQRKSIASINTSMNRIRENFGKPKTVFLEEIGEFKYIEFPRSSCFVWGSDISITIQNLNNKEFEQAIKLKNCGLGYREAYLLYAADWFDSLNNIKINSLYNRTNKEHMEILLNVKGIGEKVANCICLFAFNDLDSFPIDVWIQRILDKELLPKDLSAFDGFKGFLQQTIFYYIINNKDLMDN